MVCNSCLENYSCCHECGGYVNEDDFDYDVDTCHRCLSERIREQPTNMPKLQSKKVGEIITSFRKFGVELECVYHKTDSRARLAKEISTAWGISNDGSLRIAKDAIGTAELISPVMSGLAGEKEIVKLSQTASEARFSVNSSCGFHLHLDAPEFKRDPKEDEKNKIEEGTIFYKILKGSRMMGEATTLGEAQRLERQGYTIQKEVREAQILVNSGPAFFRLRNLW